ncbi:hypothetical protein BABINDRAFT_16297, partial [Babjeviella inositovora NRRL Y-12698]
VLDAPGLRNDFYTNLVSWSKLTGKVAVGLSKQVYLWLETRGANPLEGLGEETITSTSFSPTVYLVVGTKVGRIVLYDQRSEALLDENLTFDGKGIVCICWMPDSKGFFAGNESGEVMFFRIDESTPSEPAICLKKTFKCHQQQICAGIAINSDGSQITVGGNDNCCSIWDIRDLAQPKLRYTLPHKAAVKAIAYCPWSKSLLATGGGSKDRTIRFWHTNSGTLLDTHHIKGQVTSLIWSSSKRQLVAAFGFGDLESPVLVSVFQYPKMTPVLQVLATVNLRALCAVASPDCSSICVAANDETVRFYELWSPKRDSISDFQQGGVLGSDIIELSEGIDKDGGLIR